ncbi:TonB family protein [Pseudomonas sp.]|uniref:TonB family protein n=1 Tax=Pseudomonas sp. TaxID=306 RepID=UPI00345DC775
MWPIVVFAHNIELVPVYKLDRVYPEGLNSVSVEWQVKVYFVVASNGLVKSAEIYKASHTEFADAALLTVSNWRFEPWSTENDNPSDIEA